MTGMDENQFQSLLDEVRNDVENAKQAIADAEQTISDLSNLEKYLLQKIDSGGGAPASSSGSKSTGRRRGRSAGDSDEASTAPSEGETGMKTVEFGPDGFPEG